MLVKQEEAEGREEGAYAIAGVFDGNFRVAPLVQRRDKACRGCMRDSRKFRWKKCILTIF